MNKKSIKSKLIQRMVFESVIVSAVCLAVIAMFSFVIVLAYNRIPDANKIELLRFVANRIILVDTVLFALSLFLIVLVKCGRLISYLSELSSAVSRIGDDASQVTLPLILREVQDSIQETKERIRQKENTAREAEQRKNDLVVYLAHDLKTPIASIIGYMTLLRDEKQISTKLHDRYVETVLYNSERLDDLINEFFEITRFNLSHITLEYSSIDLTLLLQQLTFEFAPLFAEKNLTYTLDVPSSLELRCDGDKVERVFDNLLRNVISYSFPMTEVHITAKADEANVILKVCNHGKTIPQEKLSRIFEQFFRLDPSRSSRTGSSGLGLAIAKQIVELHHGSICAQSKNETTCFTITIPLHE